MTLDIRALNVRFGGVTVLDDVTLTLRPGITGLIGPNGAGKTTLLDVLSGLATPASGTVSLAGHRLDGQAPHRLARNGVRRSFQTEALLPSATVRENLVLLAENVGAPPSDVDAALRRCAVTDDGLHVAALPLIERRRVELARAGIGRPLLVLLDEPGAGLSEEDTARLLPAIRALATSGESVVLVVDHDMDLVRAVCRDVAVLDFGRLIATGPTDEVLADPRVMRAYLGTEELP